MKALLTIVFFVAFVGLFAECDDFLILAIVKGVLILVMFACVKLLPRYMTEEELNEEV